MLNTIFARIRALLFSSAEIPMRDEPTLWSYLTR